MDFSRVLVCLPRRIHKRKAIGEVCDHRVLIIRCYVTRSPSSSAFFVFAPIELYFRSACLMCYSGLMIILCRKLKCFWYGLVKLATAFGYQIVFSRIARLLFVPLIFRLYSVLPYLFIHLDYCRF